MAGGTGMSPITKLAGAMRYAQEGGPVLLGPCRCQGCGRLVVWLGLGWQRVLGFGSDRRPIVEVRRHLCDRRVDA